MSATPADVLNGAADLIERDGWCQHTRHLPSGERCLVAALWDAAVAVAVAERIATPYLRARRFLPEVVGTGVLAEWNDEPGRTQDEVIATLRTAAERAEAAA